MSTRRIAHVELFPDGALHPIKVSFFSVVFKENEDTFVYGSADSIGHVWVDTPEQASRIMKCFGLEWLNVCCFDEAIDQLSDDYLSRKAEMQATFNSKVV